MNKKAFAVIFLLITLIVFSGCIEDGVGEALKPLAEKDLTPKEPSCVPTTEICDGIDNDCDKIIDEENICTLKEKTKLLTKELVSLNILPKTDNILTEMESKAINRKENLIEVLETDIENFLETLEETSLKKEEFPTNVGKHLEELVTKTGKIEAIAWDNFETNESGTIFYLNENGKKYQLYTTSDLPMAQAKIKGYLIEDKLAFSEKEIEPDTETGYTITSTTIEPWPETLGDQSYVVVFLFEEDETPFDAQDYIDRSFEGEHSEGANGFITRVSYGKASVSPGYVHTAILPPEICEPTPIFEFAVEEVDPLVDFTQYDGLIVFHPNTSCTNYGGIASFGKDSYTTDDGEVELYKMWMNRAYHSPDHFETFVHEMGHNFGLHHAARINCNEFPNRTTLSESCTFFSYGEMFDVMGRSSYKGSYSGRNKVVVLGWIDESNVPEVSAGTFFISPFENDSTGTSNIHGLEIPIEWDLSIVTMIDEFSGTQTNLSYQGLTSYYLECRTEFEAENITQEYNNEITYGLNYSEIENGVLIRLARDNFYRFDENGEPVGYYFPRTWLLSMHPNAEIIIDYGSHLEYNHRPYVATDFGFLLEGETYYDEFNNMAITVLDTNEEGGLIEICKDSDEDGYYPCGGINLDCVDSNPNIHPFAPEVCNGYDDDCDDLVDGQELNEACGNGLDDDCDGSIDLQDSDCDCESIAGHDCVRSCTGIEQPNYWCPTANICCKTETCQKYYDKKTGTWKYPTDCEDTDIT